MVIKHFSAHLKVEWAALGQPGQQLLQCWESPLLNCVAEPLQKWKEENEKKIKNSNLCCLFWVLAMSTKVLPGHLLLTVLDSLKQIKWQNYRDKVLGELLLVLREEDHLKLVVGQWDPVLGHLLNANQI